VAEPPLPGDLVLGHDAARDRRLEQRDHLLGVELTGDHQQRQVDLAPGHGRQAQQLERGLGQVAEAAVEHVAHRRRERPAGRRQLLLAAQQPDQLDDEERVAVGAGVQLAGQPRRRAPGPSSVTGQAGLHQLAHVALAEARQLQAGGARLPRERGEALEDGDGQRLADGPHGHEDEQPDAVEVAGEQGQQLQGRAVGGLHVVEHDEQRRLRGRLLQAAPEVLEQRPARLVGVVAARDLERSAAELVEQLQPGPQRRRSRVVGAAAPRHPPALRCGQRRRRLGEPGLADAGLALQHDHGAAAARHVAERGPQPGPLRPAADQRPLLGRGDRRRSTGARCGHARDRGPHRCRQLLAQDGLLERAQLGAGVDAQLVGEHPRARAAGLERVGLRPAAHSASTRRAHSRSRSGCSATSASSAETARSGCPSRVSAVARCSRARTARSCSRLRAATAVAPVGEVGQRLAALERERPAEHRPRLLRRVGCEQPTALVDERRQHQGVDLGGRHVEQVARRARHQHLRRTPAAVPRLEHPPQVRDVRLHGAGRGRRRALAPQLVDDPVERDDPAGLQQEQRQQRRSLGLPTSTTAPEASCTSSGPRTRKRMAGA
jgi:hypothetical protein